MVGREFVLTRFSKALFCRTKVMLSRLSAICSRQTWNSLFARRQQDQFCTLMTIESINEFGGIDFG